MAGGSGAAGAVVWPSVCVFCGYFVRGAGLGLQPLWGVEGRIFLADLVAEAENVQILMYVVVRWVLTTAGSF